MLNVISIHAQLLLVLITCFTKLPFVQSTNATGEYGWFLLLGLHVIKSSSYYFSILGEEFHWTYDGRPIYHTTNRKQLSFIVFICLALDFKGWTEHMPSCGGDHQSPIDLKSDTAKVVNYPKFVFKHYHETSKEMITNNGHTCNKMIEYKAH